MLCSHAVAFVLFNLLRKQHPDLDLYGLLRLPAEDFEFQFEQVEKAMAKLVTVLIDLEQKGQVKLSEQIRWKTEDLVREGIKLSGAFHAQQPIKIKKNGMVASESFKLLFYYHNRLTHYGLEKMVDWSNKKQAPALVVAY